MRKSLLTIAMTFGMLVAPVATAAPGPNGHNDYGLCKAYFAGSENGKANKRSKGPFPALERMADDGDPDTTDDVARYCAGTTPGGKGATPRGK